MNSVKSETARKIGRRITDSRAYKGLSKRELNLIDTALLNLERENWQDLLELFEDHLHSIKFFLAGHDRFTSRGGQTSLPRQIVVDFIEEDREIIRGLREIILDQDQEGGL